MVVLRIERALEGACISEGHGLVRCPGSAAKKGYVLAPAQGRRLGSVTGSDEVTAAGASLHRCKAEGSGLLPVTLR